MSDTYQSKYTGAEIDERLEDVGTNATAIGTLASLTTTEKTNLVGAINELNTDKVETSAIVNTLTETGTGKVLDARQGKVLADLVSTKLFSIEQTITNGNFATATGWAGKGTVTVDSNVATLTLSSLPTDSYFCFRTISLVKKTIIGHKYYVSLDIYPKYNSKVRIEYGGAAEYATPAVGGEWNTREIILTATLANNEVAYLSDINSAGYILGDTIQFRNFVGIDLTETFGVGNEPTKEEIRTLVSLVPNKWWDGTLKPSQKLLLNWQLKMIRQNRDAIVALGGTIV